MTILIKTRRKTDKCRKPEEINECWKTADDVVSKTAETVDVCADAKRGRVVRSVFAFLTGVAATLIFPPYAGRWEGYVALIAFLAMLLGEYRDDDGKCGRENGSRENCCPGTSGDGSSDDRENGGENNGRSGQENNGRPVWRKWFGTAYVFGFSFYAVGFSWISNALLIDGNKFAAFIPAVFAATGLFFGLFLAVPAALAAGGRNIYARALLFCAWFVFLSGYGALFLRVFRGICWERRWLLTRGQSRERHISELMACLYCCY